MTRYANQDRNLSTREAQESAQHRRALRAYQWNMFLGDLFYLIVLLAVGGFLVMVTMAACQGRI